MKRQPSAFTLIEVLFMTAVLAITIAVVLPRLSHSTEEAEAKTCIANLTAISAAKQQWALDFKKPPTVAPNKSDIYGANLYIKAEPACGGGGVYSFQAISQRPQCTISGHTL